MSVSLWSDTMRQRQSPFFITVVKNNYYAISSYNNKKMCSNYIQSGDRIWVYTSINPDNLYFQDNVTIPAKQS